MSGGRCRDPKICPVCAAEFRPWALAQRFCSAKCQGVASRKDPVMRPCVRCGTPFAFTPNTRNRRYCSRRCGWSARTERSWADVACLNCGGNFRRRTQPSFAKVRRMFCSRLCSQNYTAGENHPAWRGGREPYFGPSWNRRAAAIRERDGNVCRRCGRTQAENGRALPVDHIIPRRLFEDIGEANNPDNLATLCDPCHGWKTTVAERKYLNGDVIDFLAFRRSLELGSAAGFAAAQGVEQ